MKTRSKKKFYCVDLFAGCGGLSLGLEEAGFFPAFVNELSPDAMETYLVNREQVNPLLRKKYKVNNVKDLVLNKPLLADIIAGFKKDYGIDVKKGELDLVVGGPPCQGFSGIGHRRSYSVDKEQLPSNLLYEDMAYIVKELRPKIFLFENVRGILSARWTQSGEKGEAWTTIYNTFKEIPGYTVRWELVSAGDYGVPQNRPRVLMVGVHDSLKIKAKHELSAVKAGFLPEPFNGYPDLEDLLGDLLDKNYENGGKTVVYPSEAKTEIQKMFRHDVRTNTHYKKGDPVTEHEYSNHSPTVVKKFEYMLAHNGEIPTKMKTKKFAQRLLPKKWGPGGPTITATSLADDYVHYSQPRVLTVREWARLQMFPDWYKFSGKRTTGGIRRAGNPREGIHEREVPKYTQIGNAVPVGLAKAVGDHFMKLLGK